MNEVGINREKWLPNPAVGELGLDSSVHGEMLEFLGRLMGVAIRSREPLDLDLPSIVWKQLVRSPITRYTTFNLFGVALFCVVECLDCPEKFRSVSLATNRGLGCCRREGEPGSSRRCEVLHLCF